MRGILAAAVLTLASPLAAEPTLVGIARLPADTFRNGPTSGQFIEAANGKTPPFIDKQPVQGVSSVVAGDAPGTYLALSDNGFGTKANSADYVLCVYHMTPDWEEQTVDWSLAFELSDPDGHVPWSIVAEGETYPDSDIPVPAVIKEKRLLTGADFDVESMVRLPDGTFWLGDEFGPFLLHVSADGKLLEPPVELPGEGMHSPDHPTKDPATAKIGRSAGFEGMSYAARDWGDDDLHVSLFPLLEKPLADGWQSVYLFFPISPVDGSATWMLLERHFPLDDGATAIGESTGISINDARASLVVERDSEEAGQARLKLLSLYRVANAKSRGDPDVGRLGQDQSLPVKSPLADLLDLADPDDLDGDGSDRFRFPYFTIESVVVVDERTVMVVNDNNYPFSDGRPEREGPDETEFILIRFDTPLAELGRDE